MAIDPKWFHLERIDGLAPLIQEPVRQLHARCARIGIYLLIVHGYRDLDSQWRLYQQGREYDRAAGIWKEVGPVVTKARPGESSHNVIRLDGKPAALGLDVIPIDGKGTALWTTPDPVWRDIYRIAAKVGLDGYGDEWGAFLPADKGHIEEPGWRLKLVALGLKLPTFELPKAA